MMTDSTLQPKKLQWKWIGITFAMYLVFYILPIYLAMNFMTSQAAVFMTGAWIFGGIILIAAVAGYLSPGVTIWEPAIAGAGLLFSLFVVLLLSLQMLFPHKINIVQELPMILIPTAIVFLLSLLGAWMGERAQKLWKTKSSEQISRTFVSGISLIPFDMRLNGYSFLSRVQTAVRCSFEIEDCCFQDERLTADNLCPRLNIFYRFE
ncbi:MAG: hypothetical protein EHM64_07815 [Ignavibacteriae bacterium]|nr:MAG: hypothetical protein EHM64_07815 [Ignavibacteriota bacterium]